MNLALTPRERAFSDRLDEAEETILQLREQLTEQLGIVPRQISRYRVAGFTKNEAAILDCLDDGAPHGFEELRRVMNATSHRAEGDAGVQGLSALRAVPAYPFLDRLDHEVAHGLIAGRA